MRNVQPHEVDALPGKYRNFAKQLVTLDGVTKPVHEWATERGIPIERIHSRRQRNSWAEALAAKDLKGETLRKVTGTIKGGIKHVA